MIRGRALSIVLLLVVVLIWGGTYVVTKAGVAELPPMLFALLRFAVASAILVPLGTIMLVPPAVAEAVRAPLPSISVASWLRILYLGALASAASYLLYGRALRDLDASQVGAFTKLAPVIGVVSGVVFLGEAVTRVAILGGVLVLVGVWMSSVARGTSRLA